MQFIKYRSPLSILLFSVKSKTRKHSRSKSSSGKKQKNKHRSKRELNIEKKIENTVIKSKSIQNKDAIAKHLLSVKRFTVPPMSTINFDQTRHKHSKAMEITEQPRRNLLKPMVKNFELDHNFCKHNNEIYTSDAYDLDKDLLDFNNDTKEVDQPAIFTEYIRKLIFY